MVAEYPRLIDAIDRHVNWLTSFPVQQPKIKPISSNTIDPKPFGYKVRQIIRDTVRSWEDGDEDDCLNEELLSVVQSAVDLSEQGDGNNAIAILEAITSKCVEHWDDVLDYGVDNYEIVQALNEAWCEAILTAELTPEEV